MKRVLSTILLAAVLTPAVAQKHKAIIETQYGKIVLKLYDDTPIHTKNFVKIAKSGQYDGLLFHRIIPQFMVQGGDPNSKNADANTPVGMGSIGDRLKAEINPKYYHKRGALAAARDNNPDKSSSGSQFYIVVGKKFGENELEQISKRTSHTFTPEQKEVYKNEGGSPHLDGNYTVFGEMISGYEVLDALASVPRNPGDRPKENQKMESVKIKKKFLFWYW